MALNAVGDDKAPILYKHQNRNYDNLLRQANERLLQESMRETCSGLYKLQKQRPPSSVVKMKNKKGNFFASSTLTTCPVPLHQQGLDVLSFVHVRTAGSRVGKRIRHELRWEGLENVHRVGVLLLTIQQLKHLQL
jgi:hypothetical protein